MKNKRPISRSGSCADAAEPPEAGAHAYGADPMSNILPFAQSIDPSVSRDPDRGRVQLFARLLALNEEMIEQLRAEQVSAAGPANFLNKMIMQHERAAALLRAQLYGHGTGPV